MRELHSDARATQDRKSEPAKEAPYERRAGHVRALKMRTALAIPEISFSFFFFTAKLSLVLGADETCS